MVKLSLDSNKTLFCDLMSLLMIFTGKVIISFLFRKNMEKEREREREILVGGKQNIFSAFKVV